MPREPTLPRQEREWLTTPEVAELFGVTPGTIRDWINKGDLFSVKIRGYNRIYKDEVAKFAKEKFSLEGEW